MKLKLIKAQNVILAFLMTLIGFGTACTKFKKLPPVEYGTPHATFKVYGKITSEQDVKIPAIRVIMISETFAPFADTVISDDNGNYEVQISDFPTGHNFAIEFADIDGPANGGTHQAKDTIVGFNNPVFENGEGWDKGETLKELNIKLKEE